MNIAVGIDEAGRGCWAGPLVAAAVILDKDIPGLDDSKKLSKKTRFRLADQIYDLALAVGVGWVDAQTIDRVGLTVATSMAMNQAISQIGIEYSGIIIDGNYNYLQEHKNVITVPGADAIYACVSAASIIAKVSRDKFMTDLACKYPQYQFEKHVGYGTAVHHQLLRQYGVCDLHRLSFRPVKALLGSSDV